MSDKAKGLIQLIAVIFFIAISLLVSSLLQSTKTPLKTQNSSDRALFVETQTIAPAPYRITFETTGTIEARSTINVVPEVSGRIITINNSFFEGGTFETGEILFAIDPRDFELEVERLEAEIARAQTTLDLTEAEANAALEEWDILNKNKDVPALVARKPQIAEAQANLRAARAQLKNAQLDLERTAFALPFNGRVLEGTLEIGQYVASGQSYGSVFDTSALEVHASLEDQKLEWLLSADGSDVTIHTRYLGQKRSYKGTLKRRAASLNNQTRFATVTFGFAAKHVDLLPGIFATVAIKGPTHKNITRIPAGALQKEGMIWIVDDDNRLQSIEPDILFSGSDHIAVRNINRAVRVVTSRVSGASNGMEIMTENSAKTKTTPDNSIDKSNQGDNSNTGKTESGGNAPVNGKGE